MAQGSWSPAALVIGVGNEFRQDDAAGLVAARQVRRRAPRWVEVVEASSPDPGWLSHWQGIELVIVIDAVAPAGATGAIHRWEAGDPALPAHPFAHFSHQVGLAEVVELARALECLPRWLLIYGIEGACFDLGRGLSPSVIQAVAQAAAAITDDIRMRLPPLGRSGL